MKLPANTKKTRSGPQPVSPTMTLAKVIVFPVQHLLNLDDRKRKLVKAHRTGDLDFNWVIYYFKIFALQRKGKHYFSLGGLISQPKVSYFPKTKQNKSHLAEFSRWRFSPCETCLQPHPPTTAWAPPLPPPPSLPLPTLSHWGSREARSVPS